MRPVLIYLHATLEHRVRKSNGVYKINGNKSDPSVVRVLSSMEKSIRCVITEGGKGGKFGYRVIDYTRLSHKTAMIIEVSPHSQSCYKMSRTPIVERRLRLGAPR